MGVSTPRTVPSSSGHAIICDGYSADTRKFHLNMGWGGDDDGWYSLPDEIPEKFTVVDDVVADLYMVDNPDRPEKPQNPDPFDEEKGIWPTSHLLWESCRGAASYNLYLWEDTGEKPETPAFQGLPYSTAGKEFKK